MLLVVTGGGTGGHVYPCISIARSFIEQHPGAEVLFVGSDSGREEGSASAAGIAFKGLALSGLVGRSPLQSARAVIRFVAGERECRKMLEGSAPFCVVGTGGYASAPACFAARGLQIPYILLEMNYKPGIVTRLLARRSYAVAMAYTETREILPDGVRAVMTGVPVRLEISRLSSAESRATAAAEGMEEFGLKPDRRTVMVVGGSQGARALNLSVWEALPGISGRDDLQVLHLTGPGDFDDERRREAERATSSAQISYTALPYTERMDLAYAVADLVVARSGAGTIAELVAAVVPSVLVPYPFAAGGHQAANAEKLAATGAAEVCGQEGDSASRAVELAIVTVCDDMALERMRKAAASSVSGVDGTRGIITLVEELARGV